MAIAEYNGMKFEYEEEHLDIHELPEITHDDAKALLFKLRELFNEKGIEFYLAFGTLLGAVRDRDFIKGDLDIDVYSKEEELIFKNLQYLKENGLELIRYRRKKVFSFRYKDKPWAYVDVFVWCKSWDLWRLYCDNIAGFRIPRRLLKETEDINFFGAEFKCVKNPIALLQFWYGDTWNIPIGKNEKKYLYEVASHYYYRKLIAKIKSSIKKVLLLLIGKL